jgi:glycine betaine catabolism A
VTRKTAAEIRRINAGGELIEMELLFGVLSCRVDISTSVVNVPFAMRKKIVPATLRRAKSGIARAQTLPQRYFVSEEIFAREEEKIFSKQWLLVGHQSELPHPGNFFTVEVANESLIIVRSSLNGAEEASIRAFYNICRHRGTRLCEEKRGHVRVIQCPYHAWTYALDGRLLGAPHMDDVLGFEKTAYSLNSVKLGFWEGFIFLNLADISAPLERWLSPLIAKFSHWNLPRLRSARRIGYDVRANWKLIFENYSECYHCPGVHPMLSKLTPYDSAENDLEEGPFLGGSMPIRGGHSLTMSGDACAIPVGDIKAEDHYRVFYYSIFPNMLLSMHPDYVMVHQLWPISPSNTLVYCDWFFNAEAFNENDFNPDDAIAFWDMTNRQDWHVCELSQQGISSRAYQPGPYSSRESIPAAWDREYLRQIGDS